jgi:type IV pilus assembly protein PilO
MNKLKELLEQLRNLDPNDPGRWPLGVRVGTVVLLFVLAAAAGYWYFVWKAKRPELLEARAKETELWNTLESKARKAANLQAYKDQLAEMEKSFGAMLRQLPNRTEVPNLLVDISQTGLAAGLEEKLFQPQGENRKDFYAELPITIRLTGDYHQMGAFASGIAALPRIVTLHDLEIVPAGRDARGGGVPTGELTLNVTAKTYRYLDEDEQESGDEETKGNSKGDSKGKQKGKKPAGKG